MDSNEIFTFSQMQHHFYSQFPPPHFESLEPHYTRNDVITRHVITRAYRIVLYLILIIKCIHEKMPHT